MNSLPAHCSSGKRRFLGERIAQRAADALRPGMRVYECKECGCWHMTSQEKRTPKPMSPISQLFDAAERAIDR